jgi:hypothetical protein
MLNRARLCVAAVAVYMALANVSASAALPTTYVYTGNTYEFFNPVYPDPTPYTTSMRQTWTLNLDDAIPANAVDFVATGHILSFFVDDGVLSSATWPFQLMYARFSTDSTAQIVAWSVLVRAEYYIFTTNPAGNRLGTRFHDWTDDLDFVFVGSLSPGTWTAIPAIPEPATAALFAFGLLGLLVIAGRRRRGDTA